MSSVRSARRLGVTAIAILLLASCSTVGSSEAPSQRPTQAPSDGQQGTAPPPSFEAVEVRLAHCVPETNIYHRAAVFFADRIAQETNRSVSVRIFPGCELGDEVTLFDLHGTDDVEVTIQYTANGGSVIPALGYLAVPFLFDSEEHWQKVVSDPETLAYWRNVVEKADKGFTIGTIGTFGVRSIYSTTKVPQSLADLNGFKMRVTQAPTMLKVWDALGANPVGLPFGELYTALQTGLVDGADSSPAGYATLKHYEAAPNFIRTNHEVGTAFFIVRTEFYEGLSDGLREVWDRVMIETGEHLIQLSVDQNKAVEDKFAELGVTEHEVPQQMLDDMRAIARPIAEDFSREFGLETFAEMIKAAR